MLERRVQKRCMSGELGACIAEGCNDGPVRAARKGPRGTTHPPKVISPLWPQGFCDEHLRAGEGYLHPRCYTRMMRLYSKERHDLDGGDQDAHLNGADDMDVVPHDARVRLAAVAAPRPPTVTPHKKLKISYNEKRRPELRDAQPRDEYLQYASPSEIPGMLGIPLPDGRTLSNRKSVVVPEANATDPRRVALSVVPMAEASVQSYILALSHCPTCGTRGEVIITSRTMNGRGHVVFSLQCRALFTKANAAKNSANPPVTVCGTCWEADTISPGRAAPPHPSLLPAPQHATLLEVAGAILVGMTYKTYALHAMGTGRPAMNKTHWYTCAKVLYNAILAEFQAFRAAALKRLADRGSDSVWVTGDMGWSHRGHWAKEGTLVLFEAKTRQVLDVEVIVKERTRQRLVRDANTGAVTRVTTTTRPSSYKKTSAAMETTAWDNIMKRWYDDHPGTIEKLAGLVVDKDTKLKFHLTASLASMSPLLARRSLQYRYDPGHVKKSLVKQLTNTFTALKLPNRGNFRDNLIERIGKRFMRLVKEAEAAAPDGNEVAMSTYFLTRWTCTALHYSTEKCKATVCTGCNCALKTEYLKPGVGIHAEAVAALRVLQTHFASEVRSFVHGYNTCYAESLQRSRLKLLPKTRDRPQAYMALSFFHAMTSCEGRTDVMKRVYSRMHLHLADEHWERMTRMDSQIRNELLKKATPEARKADAKRKFGRVALRNQEKQETKDETEHKRRVVFESEATIEAGPSQPATTSGTQPGPRTRAETAKQLATAAKSSSKAARKPRVLLTQMSACIRFHSTANRKAEAPDSTEVVGEELCPTCSKSIATESKYTTCSTCGKEMAKTYVLRHMAAKHP